DLGREDGKGADGIDAAAGSGARAVNFSFGEMALRIAPASAVAEQEPESVLLQARDSAQRSGTLLFPQKQSSAQQVTSFAEEHSSCAQFLPTLEQAILDSATALESETAAWQALVREDVAIRVAEVCR